MHTITKSIVALFCLSLSAMAAPARQPPPENLIKESWVYMLSRELVLRQQQIDLSEPGVTFNKIKYNQPGSTHFANPNFEVIYLEAWIAADDKSAALLTVPEIKNRYYTVQFLDEWGEVITNINPRTFPDHAWGRFALITPNSTAKLPADATPIVLHSNKTKMLARIEIKDDKPGALALQHKFTLTTLGQPFIKPDPAIAMFSNDNLPGVEMFDNTDAILRSAADISPNAAEIQQKVRTVARWINSSVAARQQTDKLLHERIIPAFQRQAMTEGARFKNHWLGGDLPGRGTTGMFGNDYLLRALINLAGIWANVSTEAQYYMASNDSQGQPLDGGKTYLITFPQDALPSSLVKAWWSLILVSVPDYHVVPNPLNVYNFTSYSPLKTSADGSLTLAIGPRPPRHIDKANWLPSATGKRFALTFRLYVPKAVVQQSQWSPPPVTAASDSQY